MNKILKLLIVIQFLFIATIAVPVIGYIDPKSVVYIIPIIVILAWYAKDIYCGILQRYGKNGLEKLIRGYDNDNRNNIIGFCGSSILTTISFPVLPFMCVYVTPHDPNNYFNVLMIVFPIVLALGFAGLLHHVSEQAHGIDR